MYHKMWIFCAFSEMMKELICCYTIDAILMTKFDAY